VIPLPPSKGAVHETSIQPGVALATAFGADGASGTVAGVTGLDGADGALLPTAFVAMTVNVYEVPFVRPFTGQLVVAVEQVKPPGDEVTV